jgi:predicted nucleic acid-binding Zn ribbon protein
LAAAPASKAGSLRGVRVQVPPGPLKVMPYYEYECKECGAVFDVFQHMDEPDIEYHEHLYKYPIGFPLCNGPIERKISVSSLRFIGPGFFVNDYKKK